MQLLNWSYWPSIYKCWSQPYLFFSSKTLWETQMLQPLLNPSTIPATNHHKHQTITTKGTTSFSPWRFVFPFLPCFLFLSLATISISSSPFFTDRIRNTNIKGTPKTQKRKRERNSNLRPRSSQGNLLWVA